MVGDSRGTGGQAMTAQMTQSDAKPFQQATVKAVMKSFGSKRAHRRFLVADEVGLGKTIVAREVIRGLMDKLNRPLKVVYVCSNLAIRGQNQSSLLKVLPKDERDQACCRVDRLSLITDVDEPTHPRLHLYSLTPDTSVPVRKNRRRDGRKEERALVHALVEKLWPALLSKNEWGRNVFRQGAKAHWKEAVKLQRPAAASRTLQIAFAASVRREFGLEPRQRLLPHLRTLDSEDRELVLIAHMRNALAASTIERVCPDLVIFDEFQRFRDLLSPKLADAERRVIGRLRGDDVEVPPSLLMLSATPYQLFSRRWEEESGTSHRSQFFELIEFLYGNQRLAKKKRSACEAAFQVLESELRKGEAASDRSSQARAGIERLLRPIMARTERASHPDGWTEFTTVPVASPIQSEDLRLFSHLSDSFAEHHRSSAVEYWTSIPLPMQTMGRHYLTWRESTSTLRSGLFHFTEEMRNRFKLPADWPHPRMRALEQMITAEQLATPWLAPAAHWWPLAGRWADGKDTRPRKALVFSRFQAVPQAIASMLSYRVESATIGKDDKSYTDAIKQRAFTAGPKRHATVGLFHPSPFLVENTDPIAEPIATVAEARRLIRRQLKNALANVGIVLAESSRTRPLWQLLSQLDHRSDHSSWTLDAWQQMQSITSKSDDDDAGLGKLINDWGVACEDPIETIPRSLFDALVEHALSAPGVVVGRALRRHWPDAVKENGFAATLNASWRGLRTYLDQRWFVHSLSRRSEDYPDAVRRAALDGNLEAVLDEHLWITSKLRNIEGAELATELREGMTIRSGSFNLHPIEGDRDATFQLRCHAALPFMQQRSISTDSKGDKAEKPLRTDDLRRAFNTPFWPYVLATTSVGQEGLDFHAWCDRLIHWDLCRNPADLEQREGRIQRFGGAAIRRAIVKKLRNSPVQDTGLHQSPWANIAARADEHLSDESGLAPWWVCEGGNIERFVFEVPTSEQNHWLHWMKEQRLLYRLALGQPNQEDLLEVLARTGTTTAHDVRSAVVNLSPWFGCRAPHV